MYSSIHTVDGRRIALVFSRLLYTGIPRFFVACCWTHRLYELEDGRVCVRRVYGERVARLVSE